VEVSSASANAAAQSTSAPVDTDRVAEIKAALSDGTYPLVPSKIADALIASRFMLSASE
jgi:negative regulator of flagellin synthesis FlgM